MVRLGGQSKNDKHRIGNTGEKLCDETILVADNLNRRRVYYENNCNKS